MIHRGIFERFPAIRFIVAHAGGTAPFLAWRISLFEFKPGISPSNPREIMHSSLKSLYYDIALSASSTALSSLSQLTDPSHILFGSDYPFAPEVVTGWTIEGLRNFPAFGEKARLQIERENALSLFPRFNRV
jgi:predicted TIM-barrel fold metal-dependent hydrolase